MFQQCATACPTTCANKDELIVCLLACQEGTAQGGSDKLLLSCDTIKPLLYTRNYTALHTQKLFLYACSETVVRKKHIRPSLLLIDSPSVDNRLQPGKRSPLTFRIHPFWGTIAPKAGCVVSPVKGLEEAIACKAQVLTLR